MVNEYTPILGTSGLGLSMCTIPTLVGRKKLPSNFAKKPFYLETTGPCLELFTSCEAWIGPRTLGVEVGTIVS